MRPVSLGSPTPNGVKTGDEFGALCIALFSRFGISKSKQRLKQGLISRFGNSEILFHFLSFQEMNSMRSETLCSPASAILHFGGKNRR